MLSFAHSMLPCFQTIPTSKVCLHQSTTSCQQGHTGDQSTCISYQSMGLCTLHTPPLPVERNNPGLLSRGNTNISGRASIPALTATIDTPTLAPHSPQTIESKFPQAPLTDSSPCQKQEIGMKGPVDAHTAPRHQWEMLRRGGVPTLLVLE
jgi:hypothetical protein